MKPLLNNPHPFNGQIKVGVTPCHWNMDASNFQEFPVSNRSTVAHCKEPLDIHVFMNALDEENIHIEFNRDSSSTNFTVPLGVALACARRLISVLEKTERCAAMTDDEIISHCSAAVDDRMSFHRSIRGDIGAMLFGSPEDHVDQQIRRGVESMRVSRNKCRNALQMADRVERGLA